MTEEMRTSTAVVEGSASADAPSCAETNGTPDTSGTAATPEPAPEKRRRGRPKAPLVTHRQQLSALRASVKAQGALRTVDARTAVGKQLLEWKRALVEDLGGEEAMSTQRKTVVDVLLGDYWILLTIDAELIGMPHIVNRRNRKVVELVLQRARLADGLARRLDMLGLDRKRAERPVPTVAAYLAGDGRA